MADQSINVCESGDNFNNGRHVQETKRYFADDPVETLLWNFNGFLALSYCNFLKRYFSYCLGVTKYGENRDVLSH